MTTLYRPVLIESAEQAEALPVGTLAKDGDLSVAVKAEDGHWARTDVADGLPMMGSSSMVGWSALVPIEAEEEWKTLHEGSWHLKSDEDDARRDVNSLGARRRYTTDWEEA